MTTLKVAMKENLKMIENEYIGQILHVFIHICILMLLKRE